jgi:hypothetical protein
MGCLLFKEGNYEEALAEFNEAAAVLGSMVRHSLLSLV